MGVGDYSGPTMLQSAVHMHRLRRIGDDYQGQLQQEHRTRHVSRLLYSPVAVFSYGQDTTACRGVGAIAIAPSNGRI